MDSVRKGLLVFMGIALLGSGCAREIEAGGTKSLSAAIEAQFDPTHRIPVLQLVPSPTALAERGPEDHRVNFEAVQPEPCELPDKAQCLQLVEGWPTNTYPTLYFSAEVDLNSVPDGIVWKELKTGRDIAFTASQAPRPAPREACKAGGNGAEQTYTDADIPPGVELVLTPTAPLAHDTTYAVWVRSDAEGGLRSARGGVVQPSALFSLLNRADPAVEEDGSLPSAVLRSQVQSVVLHETAVGDVQWAELSEAQRSTLAEGVKAKGLKLYQVSAMMRGLVSAALEQDLVKTREQIVLANMWTTGPAAGPEVQFDPTNSLIPIPNDQLLLLRDAEGAPLHVNLPTEGLTGASLSTAQGLNRLDGFSTLAPISVPVSRSLDPDSIPGNIFMYEVVDGVAAEEVPLHVVQSATDSEAPITLSLIPAVGFWQQPGTDGAPRLMRYPLKPGRRYVVGLKAGLRDLHGVALSNAAAFSLLRSPLPLPQVAAKYPDVKQKLQCAYYQGTGQMPTDDQLNDYLNKNIEAKNAEGQPRALDRASWQPVFEAFEAMKAPLKRDDLLMAFGYTTQQLNREVEAGKAKIAALAGSADWVEHLAAYVQRGPFPGQREVSNAARFDEEVCAQACAGFSLASADNCKDVNWLKTWSIECTALRNVFFSEIGAADTYGLRSPALTRGNPYAAGAITAEALVDSRTEQLKVWVVRPKGDAPAGGWPVVIFQHPLTSDASKVFMIVNSLAKQGFATAAMDLPFHGSRISDVSNDTTGAPCMDVDPAAVKCEAAPRDGEDYVRCTGGCDGRADAGGTGFLSPNAFGVRGNLQQAVVDQLNLVSAIQAGKFSGLDGGQIHYLGMSIGSVTGSALLSHLGSSGDNPIRRAVLNTGAGSLMDLLMNAGPQLATPMLGALVSAGVCEPIDPERVASGCKETPTFKRFKDFGQWGMDAADPVALTRLSDYPADRLLFQVVQDDPIFANMSTVMLERAYGVEEGSERHQRWSFDQVEGSCHGFLLDVSCSGNGRCAKAGICATLAAQDQAARFLKRGDISLGVASPGLGFNCNNPCD